MMSWLAPYHYIFVHFPIASIFLAVIAELSMKVGKRASLVETANFLLISAFLFILPTIATGLLLEEGGVSENNRPFMELHETFAFITLALATATLLILYWRGRGALYYVALTLLLLSVATTAHFGGTMAFGPISYFP